jgi:hypothetical protein
MVGLMVRRFSDDLVAASRTAAGHLFFTRAWAGLLAYLAVVGLLELSSLCGSELSSAVGCCMALLGLARSIYFLPSLKMIGPTLFVAMLMIPGSTLLIATFMDSV